MLVLDDTIVAIATANQPAQRGIIRLSGPDLIEALRPTVSLDGGKPLTHCRRATVHPCRFQLDDQGREIAGKLYLWPVRRSYTRQPTAELHLIGSPPLLQTLLRRLCESGARLARPGEFTLRAFLAGRIDLAKAEAVLGAIDATDNREFRVALAQMAGGLSRRIDGLRDSLLNLCADLEAGLDFVDEDIEFISTEQLENRLAHVAEEVSLLLHQIAGRQVGHELTRVLICGAPNAGKSTLFNALVGNSAAITSSTAGTTRDFLAAQLELGNQRVELVDTPGMDTAAVSQIDAVAQKRAQKLLRDAQLLLLCLDRTRELTDFDRHLLDLTRSRSRIILHTKADQPAAPRRHLSSTEGDSVLEVCAMTGDGLTQLLAEIAFRLAEVDSPDLVSCTAARSSESLRLTLESVERAQKLAQGGGDEELIAAEMRSALDFLGMIVGAIYTDDLLDRVFSRFCIGK